MRSNDVLGEGPPTWLTAPVFDRARVPSIPSSRVLSGPPLHVPWMPGGHRCVIGMRRRTGGVDGDRLPPARELATGLDVNMHTVLRAYGMLRDESLIDVRRGRGAQVVADAGAPLAAQLREQVKDLVAQAARLGLTREQLIEEIRKATP